MESQQYIFISMIGSEDRPTSTHMYSLAFKDTGELVVVFKRDYDDAYRRPEQHEILPSEFGRYTVDGIPLKELVVKKLLEILPK